MWGCGGHELSYYPLVHCIFCGHACSGRVAPGGVSFLEQWIPTSHPVGCAPVSKVWSSFWLHLRMRDPCAWVVLATRPRLMTINCVQLKTLIANCRSCGCVRVCVCPGWVQVGATKTPLHIGIAGVVPCILHLWWASPRRVLVNDLPCVRSQHSHAPHGWSGSTTSQRLAVWLQLVWLQGWPRFGVQCMLIELTACRMGGLISSGCSFTRSVRAWGAR